jgi:hypothetical protein
MMHWSFPRNILCAYGNRNAGTRSPNHPGTEQFSFIAGPILFRTIPCIQPKSRGSKQLERVLLPATGAFAPIGLAFKDNPDVLIRGERLFRPEQYAVFSAFHVNLDEVDPIDSVFGGTGIESRLANYFCASAPWLMLGRWT